MLPKQLWGFQEAAMCSELRGHGRAENLNQKQVKLKIKSFGYLVKVAVLQSTFSTLINIGLKTICWIL